MKYKLLCYSLFLISSSSYAIDVYCGPGYDDFNVVKGQGVPGDQASPITLVTKPIITPEEAYTNGLSVSLPVECGFVSHKKINGYKTNNNYMNFGGSWSPTIENINTQYVDRVPDPGQYRGDRVPQNNNKMRAIANEQTRNNLIFLKSNVTEIPPNTTLFKLRLHGRLDLANTRDENFTTYIRVVTGSKIQIQNPTCDFSATNTIVNLKSYNGGGSTSQQIPLEINCNLDNTVNITLKGQAESSNSSILKNTSTNNPAKGIGFKIFDMNGDTLSVNIPKAYRLYANEHKKLFSTDYAPVPSSRIKAGNVQSVVNIEMEYN